MTDDERRAQAWRDYRARNPTILYDQDGDLAPERVQRAAQGMDFGHRWFDAGWDARQPEIDALTALLWEHRSKARELSFTLIRVYRDHDLSRDLEAVISAFDEVDGRVRAALNESDHVEP